MSRKLRIEYPGAMYHVMNRGDQREDIFRDDQDRQKLLSTLGEKGIPGDTEAGRGQFARATTHGQLDLRLQPAE